MDTLAPFRTYFRWAALACSFASAGLTLAFGIQQNPWLPLALLCAIFLVACSLASDYVVLFISDAYKKRDWGGLALVTVGGAFVFSLNLMSNLGSVGWQKDVTVTAAKFHNIKVEDERKTIADAEQKIAHAEKRLSDLVQANGWAATVATADALRARLESAQKAIEIETSRGGCKARCLTLMQDKGNLESRIATVEAKTKLQTDIDNARAELAVLRSKARDAKPQVAAADSQAQFFSSLIKVDLKPSEEAQQWTSIGMSGWLALGLCIAPIMFSFIGWRTDEKHHPARTVPPVEHRFAPPPAPVNDNADIWRAIRTAINQPAKAS